jgi:hypothetical protein
LVTVLRWIAVVLLAWGLFTGVAFVLVPLVTNGWGNTASFFAGVGLIVTCGAGLIHIEPRRARHSFRSPGSQSEVGSSR